MGISVNRISKNSKDHYFWPNYAQGPKCSSKSLKQNVGRYVGDNRVLLSNNIDPTSYDRDLKNNNERLTIQIHKFAEVYVADQNETILKDVYAIRMMLPKF